MFAIRCLLRMIAASFHYEIIHHNMFHGLQVCWTKIQAVKSEGHVSLTCHWRVIDCACDATGRCFLCHDSTNDFDVLYYGGRTSASSRAQLGGPGRAFPKKSNLTTWPLWIHLGAKEVAGRKSTCDWSHLPHLRSDSQQTWPFVKQEFEHIWAMFTTWITTPPKPSCLRPW